MPASDRAIDLAGEILDGRSIDWASAESSVTEPERPLLDELRVLAAVADLHRHEPVSWSSGSMAAAGPAPPEEPPGPALESALFDESHWGHLRLLERIGRGTFGEVYRAWDTRLDREVALKLLPAGPASSDGGTTSIIREGRLLARVRHPNVVTIYGAEQIDDRIGLWMEFVRGRTLEQLLEDGKRFTIEEILNIGRELCLAVSAVHRAGLLHRDIKAQNVVLADDGRAVLMDLGTGRELMDDRSSDLAGTPLYLAPEIFHGQQASARSDVYSIGVLLYHLATCSYPITGRSVREVVAKQSRGERTALQEKRPDLPQGFVAIVERALSLAPEARYSDVSDLGIDLAALSPARRENERASPPPWWRSRAAAAALVTIAIAAVGLWPALWHSSSPVIAVLPFENLSTELDSDHFVDGLTDEIIRNLSEIDGLEVRSRTSSFTFKDKPRNLVSVGKELDANLVVEGSVLRSGEKLRVNAHLVRVPDDTPIWSGKFDRELKDIFDIQDEISLAIVNELRLKLGGGQRRYHVKLEAYELYLKARALIYPHSGAPDGRLGAELLEQVIAKDPAFAPAHAGLVDAWAILSINYAGVPPNVALARMEPAAKRALELDPLLAEAHAAVGVVLARKGEWRASEAAFRRAIDLNRNLPSVHTTFAISALFPQEKVEEALRELNAALRVDPLSPHVRGVLAWVQVSAGRYDEAIANCRRVLAVAPESQHEKQVLARALFLKGEVAEALSLLESWGRFNDGVRGYIYARTGRRSEAEELALSNTRFPARTSLIYAGLGDKRRTFEALEEMAVNGEPRAGIHLTYPELAMIRDDPRLKAFRRRLGLPRS